MKKLSVSVQLRSIGWVVTENNKVVDSGIKRVNTDFDAYYEFAAGLPVSKRINRREKRQARRNNWRRKSRRQNLIKFIEQNYHVASIPTYTRDEMLNLRVKALHEQLSSTELSAVLLSLQRKRGYKSQRGVNDNDNSDYLQTIAIHEENLKNYRSIAEYLKTLPSSLDIIFTRESYEAEFRAICKAQGIVKSDQDILWRIIYFQRPLRRGKLASCPLDKNRKVCHYSHPQYQYFRILRDVANICISDPMYNEVEISAEQRKAWVTYLQEGKNLTKAKACKDLGIKRSTGYSWLSGKQISGNIVVQAFGDNNSTLWQELFSARDESKLAILLNNKYPTHDIEALIDIDFNACGWGDYSHKAISKLIPFMECGLPLREAILQVYGEVDLKADIALRNLVVEQHYASYCSLIEAVKEKYAIDEVAIEVSHLLKAGNKSRKAIAKAQRAEKKASDKYTSYQQQLLKLWEEFGKVSP
ncbi:MAG: type II CRISPR RNA-guided endonuclease Cas9, partial [Bacteroidales bacterium]